MKLVVIVLFLSLAIVLTLKSQKNEVAVKTEKTVESNIELVLADTDWSEQAPVEVAEPAMAIMPSPVLLQKDQVDLIEDEKLRNFVKNNAIFDRDTVLYFEWRGGPDDTMEGITASDLATQYKRYVIRLVSTRGEHMLHRQVFIIPSNYTYEVEMSK